MVGATVESQFADRESETELLRTHLADAWDRFEASDYWDHGWFRRYGRFDDYEPGPEAGLVRPVLESDPDALLESESVYWENLRRIGVLRAWPMRRDRRRTLRVAAGTASERERSDRWKARVSVRVVDCPSRTRSLSGVR
jgi:hypothetical protein